MHAKRELQTQFEIVRERRVANQALVSEVEGISASARLWGRTEWKGTTTRF